MTYSDWIAILITLKLATLTALILLVLCFPLAYLLARSQRWYKPIIEAFITLPLVLPPAVLGFYFLVLFSPNHAIGQFIENKLGLHLIFSFEGLVLASIIYSLPFTFRPLQSAFELLPDTYLQSASLLGFTPFNVIIKIVLPMIRPAIYSALTLTFAHTVGEFGLILMIGGNIPGETQVVSLAIFEHVESMNFTNANHLSLIMVTFAFIIVLISQVLNRHQRKLRTF